jgi:hypothetical protein
MSLYKTKLCRHWLNGYCKMESNCRFIHGDCEHGRMEHGRARMVHDNIYHDTHKLNNYHGKPHHSPNYMHDNHKEGFPLDHGPLSRPCKTQVSRHMNVEYFSRQSQPKPEHKEVQIGYKKKSGNDLEEGEIAMPITTQKHHKEEDFSEVKTSPKHKKLRNDNVNKSEQVFLTSVSPTCKELKGDKNDKVNDDCNKSSMVEVFEGKQEKIQGESDLVSLLSFSPEDHRFNIENYDHELDEEIQTNLDDCGYCKNLEYHLNKTLKENAVLKNALQNVYKEYNQMEKAKSIFKESIRTLEPFCLKT